MFKQEDYRHFRATPSSRLQIFPRHLTKPAKRYETPSLDKRYKQNYFKYLREVLYDFVDIITIHGLERVVKTSLRSLKSITWLVGFSFCFVVLVYVSSQVATRYRDKPLVTVISNTHLPIYAIPFPELTVCNKNRLNWQRYEQAKQKFLRPQHLNKTDYENIFMEVVNAYDTLIFGKFYKFENLTKLPPQMLQDMNYVNFSLVVKFMSWKCHEVLTNCLWLNEHFNCCDIFFMRNSQMGLCLAFNTIESAEGREKQISDPYWPWRAKGMGSENGLKVRVHVREFQHSPLRDYKKGILVMLTEPNVWFNYPIEVNTHTRTSIAISASLHVFNNHTRLFSSKVRQCVFEDEIDNNYFKTLQNYPYMFENCQAECQQEYLVKFCNCTFDKFYPVGRYRPCQLSDYPCLFQHNDKLRYFEQIGETEYVSEILPDFMKCECYYNCKSLNYIPDINTAYYSHLELNSSNSFVDLVLFYKQDTLMVFMTNVIYTWIDLMASFGGLAGLCIGCSLISLVEIIYFFSFDIPHNTWIYYRKKKQLNLKKKRLNIRKEVLDGILRS